MTIKLETQSIRSIATFEKITKVNAKDCIITDSCIYFLVDPEKVGLAIGKGGSNIKEARKVFDRNVKVFGYHDDPKELIKSMIPNISSLEISNGSVTLSVPNEDRVAVIGRGGSNIKAIRAILERHFDIKKVRLK